MSETSSTNTETSNRVIGLVLCLRAARSVLGWSQAELAAKAEVSKPALNRLERFESEPRLETILKIEDALAVAGVRLERRADGEFAMIIGSKVITEMAARIEAGESVTARGKVNVKDLGGLTITASQAKELVKKHSR